MEGSFWAVVKGNKQQNRSPSVDVAGKKLERDVGDAILSF